MYLLNGLQSPGWVWSQSVCIIYEFLKLKQTKNYEGQNPEGEKKAER